MEYLPIIKSLGFNPSPVAGKIPYYADSRVNDRCVGSKAHSDFWEEQIYYCLNGYDTGGLHIPGRYYYYLNFTIIDGLNGKMYPDFTDVHYELYSLLEDVKKNNKAGIIIPKARRQGLSLFGVSVINYGIRFVEGYRAGVAAGLDSYCSGFRNKLYKNYNNTVKELKMNNTTKNNDDLILGYEERTEQGFQMVVNSHVQFKTMKDQATKFEGEYFHDVICEESGEFENVDKFVTSTIPALRIGKLSKGNLLIYGTGGNMLKGSRAFKELWHNAESLNIERFFISGKRFYPPFYVGYKDEKGKNAEEVPLINKKYKGLKREQLLGCGDEVSAEQSIKDERRQLAKNKDRRKLVEHNQNYALTIEDVFTSSGSNNFNNEKLYLQGFEIDSLPQPKWMKYRLEYKKDANGDLIKPLEVEAIPAKDTDKEYDLVKIYKHPKTEYKDLDVGGADTYNQDKTNTSESLGGIVVLRRNDTIISPHEVEENGKIPICVYYDRPPRKEMHWDMCLKISIYYNLVGNMMISAEQGEDIGALKYFKDNLGKKYLAKRPRSFDSIEGKQVHEYGVKMTAYSKPRMLGLMQTWVEDDCEKIWFIEIIRDLIAYDDENIGTDWDLADAIGLALMRIADMKRIPTEQNTIEFNPFIINRWQNSESGRIFIDGNKKDEKVAL